MSLTIDTYVEKVFQQVSRGLSQDTINVRRAAIEAGLDLALLELAEEVSESQPPYRTLLQKSFVFTLSSGQVSLATEPTLMVDTIPATGRVSLTGVTEDLQYVPHYQDLVKFPQSWAKDYTYYSFLGNTIYARTSTGAVPTATALTIYSSYIPTLSEVSGVRRLENHLIKIGVALVTSSISPTPPANPGAA